ESVVVAGYVHIGRAICLALEQAKVPYTAFDVDPDALADAKTLGHNVRYADVGDSAVLSAIAIERARLVVATNGTHPSTRRMIDHLGQFHPNVPVVVAVPYLAQRDELRRSGTNEVFALAPEGVVSFGRQVLDRLGVGAAQAEAIARTLNADDYAILRRGSVGSAGADEQI